jgi:hypothetical protein
MAEKTQIVITAKDETAAAFKSVQNSLGTLSRSASALIPALGGIGAALSVGSFAAAINDSIKFAASLDDMAERTGATVENLSALSDVAKIGGHDLGMVETSVIKLNKALHGSDDESKGAAKAIAALGLSVDELRAKDPAQAMLDVAKALNEFADGGGKSALAMALLGKAGAQALPYLKDLAEQGEQVTKVTAEQAAQAEQYEKSMARLSLAISSTSRALALEFLPVLSRMSGELAAATQAAGGFFNYFTTAATVNPLKTVQENIRAIGAEAAALEDKVSIGRGSKKDEEQLGKLNEKLKVLRAIDDVRKKQLADGLGIGDIEKKKSLDGFVSSPEDKPKKAAAADEAARLIQQLNEQIALKEVDAASTDKLTAAEQQRAKVLYQIEAGTLKVSASQREKITNALDELVVLDRTLQAQKEYTDAVTKQEEANRKGRDAMQEQISAAEKATELYGLTASQISVVEQARLAEAIAIAEQNGATDEQIEYLKEELRLRGALSDALIGGDTKRYGIEDAKKAIEAVSELDEFTKSAAKNMQSAFADFLFDPFAEGSDKMLQKFGETVQRMIAEAASAQLMKLLLGDYASGGKTGDSGLIGAIPWGEILSAFAFKDGGIMTSSGPVPLRKYASGGIANSAQLAMFGEGSTPEAYVPLPDGRRIPVAMSGGGRSVNQVMNFYGAAEPAQVKRAAAAGARQVVGISGASARYA